MRGPSLTVVSQPMSAPRFVLRCFVVLGIAAGMGIAVGGALAGEWLVVPFGLVWAAFGAAIFVGPNEALAKLRLRDALAKVRLRWRLWRLRPR